MNIKQFSEIGGCKVVLCGPGWGGKYGYTTKDSPNSTTCGFKTKHSARKGWMEDTFGETAAQAIVKLLEEKE